MGCGESKHAVATTESVSSCKKLSSTSSKKVEGFEFQNDPKSTTKDKNGTTGSIPSTSLTLSIPLPVDEKINIIQNINNNGKKENSGEKVTVVQTNNKGSSIIENSNTSLEMKEEEGSKEVKVVESLSTKEKANEMEVAHERELSRDSQFEYLFVSEAKYESNEEPMLEETNKLVDQSNGRSELTENEKEGEIEMESFSTTEKAKEMEVAHERELTQDSQFEYLSVNETKSESNEEPKLEETNNFFCQSNEGSELNQNEKEEEIETDKLDIANEVTKEVKNVMALAEAETTPKAEKEKAVIATMDP